MFHFPSLKARWSCSRLLLATLPWLHVSGISSPWVPSRPSDIWIRGQFVSCPIFKTSSKMFSGSLASRNSCPMTRWRKLYKRFINKWRLIVCLTVCLSAWLPDYFRSLPDCLDCLSVWATSDHLFLPQYISTSDHGVAGSRTLQLANSHLLLWFALRYRRLRSSTTQLHQTTSLYFSHASRNFRPKHGPFRAGGWKSEHPTNDLQLILMDWLAGYVSTISNTNWIEFCSAILWHLVDLQDAPWDNFYTVMLWPSWAAFFLRLL